MANSFYQLHDELISEILSRLSARSLLGLRCVSKSWKDLIDSPNFIKLQLSHNGSSEICFFFGTDCGLLPSDPTGITLMFERFDLINNSLHSLEVPLSFPFGLGNRVAGSCHGLFCLASVTTDSIVLVNPCIRKSYCIPHPRNRRVGLCEVGFGYDPSTDEYKVVWMQRVGNDPNVEVNIYYLKSKKCKRMLLSSNYHRYLASLYACYSHGALHWGLQDTSTTQSSSSRESLHIAIFDLVKEKFTVSKYDKAMFGNPNSFELRILGGWLSLSCWGKRKVGGPMLDIWVMKEYGVEESWIKLFSFDIHIVPLALSKCGRRLLIKEYGYSDLYWYDVDSKTFMYTNTSVRNTSSCDVCYQSLVRLS